MPTRVRIGSSRPGGGRPSPQAVQTYDGTTSGYGATRADSIGYSPQNPKLGAGQMTPKKAFAPASAIKAWKQDE